MESAKNVTKKALSIVLSVLMVVTMFPVIAISSFAEGGEAGGTDAAFTKPVVEAGGWEHEQDANYTDGRGTHYVSMKMDKTEFTFMQTKDNEKFTFAPMFQAVKNDGVNYVKLTGVTENHIGYTPASAVWSANKSLNSKNETTTPNGAALPGSLSQGYKKQLAQNTLYWNYTVVFEGEGEAEYTTTVLIDYKAGPYSMNTKAVDNYNTIDEPIVITIKVVDERELIAAVEKAQELIDSGAVTGAEATEIQNLINQAESNHMTDGTVPYTQEQIDSMANAIKGDFPMDFTEYNNALSAAQAVIADPNADQDLKDMLTKEITVNHPSDKVLACDKNDQAYVDEATQAIKALLATETQEPVGAPSSVAVPTSKPATWVFDVDKSKVSQVVNWSSSKQGDATLVTLPYENVYLDVTESLGTYNMTWNADASSFSKSATTHYFWRVAGPLSPLALSQTKIDGNDVNINFDDYFENYSDANATNDNLRNGNEGWGSAQERTASAVLNGDVKSQYKDAASITDTPYTITIGSYFGNIQDGSFFVGGDYEFKSYEGSLINPDSKRLQYYRGPYRLENGQLSSSVSYPGFNLYIYDKTPLMNAINDAVTVDYNGASNWSDWVTALANAKNVYNDREVVQSQIDEAKAALDNFVFEFDVTFTTDPQAAEITLNETAFNGASIGTISIIDNTIHFIENESITVTTASSSIDYTFTGWSDGDTNATRTITFSRDIDASKPFVAQYIKNYADYTAVDEAIANVPDDLSIYSQDSVAELQKAIANVTRDLPLSQQDTVDAYADAINEALANLQKLPANYNGLDAAIEAADALPLDAIAHDQAKVDLVEAIHNAKNIDRDLDSTHQAEIDAAEQALLDALNAVTVLPADYSELENLVAQTPANPESYYSAESYAAYEKALAAAEEVLATKGTADEYNVLGQPIIDKAVEDLKAALNDLTPNGECYYGDLDAAIAEKLDIEEEFYTEDSLQAYKDALAAAQAVERGMVNDNEGVNQGIIDNATQTLKDATNALAIKGADYSELDAELARTPAFDQSTASAESWAKYEEALKAAEEITRNLTILDQGYIDEVTKNLADAKNELVAAGDCYYGNLDSQIERAESLNEDDFTPESWAAIQTALENAQNIDRNLKDNDGGANQATIDNATQAIKDAIKNAVETVTLTIMNGDTVMYTTKVAPGTTITDATTNTECNDAYTAAITGAKVHLGSYYGDGSSTNNSDPIYYDETIYLVIIDVEEGLEVRDNATDKVQAAVDAGFPYTSESVQKLADAIKAAEDYVDAEQPHSIHQNQREFDALVDAVKDAANALVYDKTKVNNAIADAEAFDQDKYTDSTAQALQDAIDNAKAVAADDNATVADMQNAIDAINDAITNLRPDKTDLDNILDDAKAIPQDKYTDETASDLQDAIDEAQRVIDDPDSTLEEVENALADLQDAIAGLVPEKGPLTDLVDDAKNTDTEGKTDSSTNALEDAIKNAEDVLADPDATVDEIDEAIKNLQDAINGLEDKADYTAEQEAYDEIKAIDTTNLTPETKQKIEDAIAAADALDKDLPVMKQGDVDAVTDALKDAIRDAAANELNNILDDAKNTDTTGKTDASTDALEDAIKDAEDLLGKTDPAATKEEIDEAIKAIEDAIAGLEDKADYTDEEAAYDKATDIDTSKLSDEAKKALEDAIAAADALDKDLPADEQATVDAVTDALIEAIKDAEKEALADLLDDAKDTDTTGKTDSSSDALEDAIQNAEDVLADPDATPEEIEKAIKDLEDAIAGLEDKADYTDEEAAYDKAKDIDTTNLSEEAKKALEDAIAAADALDKDLPADEQGTVDAVTEALIEAIANAEKEALSDLLDEAKGTDTDGMTPESKQDLEDAIKNAEDVLADPDATPEEIEDAIKDLQDAIDGLTPDKSDLEDLINDAEAIDQDKYTDDTASDLQDAIDAAKDVLDNPDATVEEIKDALDNLQDAIDNLDDEIVITIVDENGDPIATITEKVGTTIDEIAEDLKDEIPQNDGDKELVGFVDEEGNYIPGDTIPKADEVLKPVYELTKITPNDDSVIGIERRDDLDGSDGLIDGFTVGANTVADIKASLENDELQISVVNINGTSLGDTDLVGTGAVITYTSKLTGKVYEKLTVILYGDVNGDGLIDENDIDTFCAVSAADEKLTNIYFIMAADCDGDTAVDGIDATYAICTANGIDCIEQSRLILK